MLKSAAGKVMWLGRTMVFLIGLTVVFALVLGATSMALGATGKPFLLGKDNVASKVSALTNRGLGAALSLNVRPDQPPLAVNSSTNVENLNADLLDGLGSGAFLRGPVYSKSTSQYVRPGLAVVECEAGDTPLSGGYLHPFPDDSTVAVYGDGVFDSGYRLAWKYTNTNPLFGQEPFYGQMLISVTCADTDGDGPGAPVLVEGASGQSPQNAAAEFDLRNGAKAAEACAADNDGSYVPCTEASLIMDYGWDQTEGVNSTVTNNSANNWTATARHVDSSTLYTYSTEDNTVREQ